MKIYFQTSKLGWQEKQRMLLLHDSKHSSYVLCQMKELKYKKGSKWLKLSFLTGLESRDVLPNALPRSHICMQRTEERKIFCLLRMQSKSHCVHKVSTDFSSFCWCPYADSKKRKGSRTTLGLLSYTSEPCLKSYIFWSTRFKNQELKLLLLSFAVSVEEIGPLRTGLFTSHPEHWRYANN